MVLIIYYRDNQIFIIIIIITLINTGLGREIKTN